jgi:Tannase and feruloyl esterase
MSNGGRRDVMGFPRSRKRSIKRARSVGVVVAVLAICGAAPAMSSAATGHSDVGNVPTLSSQDSDAGLANLPAVPAKMTCAQLAQTTEVAGQSIQITEQQTASASPGSPEYCAVTGHINTTIGFEILLPTKTWRQRYLQVGCGGLCGNIGINPNQTTGYKPVANGYFVLAAEDDGHSGNDTGWYSNALQRVQFAYLSYHDVALVAKGLAQKFYGVQPRYSYFDGCSQGGHEALGEVQRYPTDFNGVLAGAPASIMTELNSILHEYTYAQNYADGNYSAPDTSPILDQPEANTVLSAAMKACYPTVGLMLDYRDCERKFNLDSVKCSATLTSNCLTPAQIAVVRKIWNGPVDPQGQHLYPGGYSLGSEFNWSNGTSANLPLTPGATVMPATFITSWLQYFAFGTPETGQDIGTAGVANEPFTAAYFKQIEKLAPYWDATDPNLRPFERAGGKLILWQGEADWSIPTITSIAYYQAVVRAMGGLAATQRFAKYYLLPSVGHCGGNGPDTYNGLGAVVAWTEKHISPNALVATQYAPATGGGPGGPGGPGGGSTSDLTDTVPTLGAPSSTAAVRSINLYPYPELPAYKGHGDVNDASSYVGKVSNALQAPTPWLGSFDSRKIWCNSAGLDCRETNGFGWPLPRRTSRHRRT